VVQAISTPASLRLEGVTKRFDTPHGPRLALSACTISVHAREIVALVGPNGAGKSTALRVVAGVVRPERGSVHLTGRCDPDRAYRAARLGGLLDGAATLYPRLTVRENVEYCAVLKGLSSREASVRASCLLARFGLAHRSDDLFQKLSRGMRQRVAIACHVVHGPAVLVLDEPTLGVDSQGRAEIADLLGELRRGGTAVLLASHDAELVGATASRVAFMRDGAIASWSAGSADP
jgi:ABC-type multidrug transport system ATPase subunit